MNMSFPVLFLIHFIVIFIVPLCMILGMVILFIREENKMKQRKVIDVSNHRDDTKFEYIKTTIESTSNWVITDPLSCIDTPDDDKKTQTKME